MVQPLSAPLPQLNSGRGTPGALCRFRPVSRPGRRYDRDLRKARSGYDQAFSIEEQLYRRLGRRFEPELALWGASDDVHMVMIATFGVTRQRLPVEMASRSSSWTGWSVRPSVREGPALQPWAEQRDLERRAHGL